MRRRRPLPARDRASGDAPPRERACKGLFGRTHRDGRAARRVPQPRCPAACPEPRLGRRERRSRPARTPRAAADRRRRSNRRGAAAPGCRRARGGGAGAGPAAGQGRALARERHAVHGRLRRARRPARATPRQDGGHRVRPLARSAAGVALQLHPADPGPAAAQGPGRVGGERPAAARGLGDQRVPPLVRPGPGRLLAALRATGARRLARPARLLHGDGRRRAERRDRQPARARRGRDARLERELPRSAARVRARRARDGGQRAGEHRRAASRAPREPRTSPAACPRS